MRAYVETYGLPATITNCSNNYGPFQFPEKVIPLFAAHALDDRPLPLYESTANRREWLHVVDHCRAIEAVLERGRIGETYHVGSGVEASIEEIADAVLAVLGQAGLAQEDRPRPSRPRPPLPARLHQDHHELGWAPTVGFEEGLADTVRWYADNRDWWEPLMDRAPVVESRRGPARAAIRLALDVRVTDPAGPVAVAPLRADDSVRVLVTGRRRPARPRRRRRLAGRGPRVGAGDVATVAWAGPSRSTAADHALLDVSDRTRCSRRRSGAPPRRHPRRGLDGGRRL